MRHHWKLNALLITLLPIQQLRAQEAAAEDRAFESHGALSLNAGVSRFDLAGTGTMPLLAARAEFPVARPLLVEGGIAVASMKDQYGVRSNYVMPEVQLQLQVPRTVAPYLGVGMGMAAAFSDNRDDFHLGTSITYSVAGGVRVWVSDRMAVRGELRIREFGQRFTATTADWTLGVAWKL